MRRVPGVAPGDAIPDLLHRLRNPMAAIKAGISLVRHTARPDRELLGFLDQMLHEVGRLDAATRDTQRYFRVSAGRPMKVLVADAAREACAAARAEAERTGAEIVLQGGEDVRVKVDRDQLLYALTELVSNACRHSPVGGRVRVSWRRGRSGAVALAVADAGAGIPVAHARDVGKPYFTTSHERTGLGLATVARVCELAGGALRGGGAAGGGCRFTMELPNG